VSDPRCSPGSRTALLGRDRGAFWWFSPTWNTDGKKHDIRLEVRKSELRVRVRRSYSDLSLRAQQALESQSRRVIATAGSVER
jgi:hypothetical protein